MTGIAGFLGSHLADALLAAGHEVVGNDNLSEGDRSNVARDVVFHHLDCNDRDTLALAMKGCEAVVHCAANPYEALSIFSPYYIMMNGIAASVSTFSAAISAGVRRIVYLSSAARYGNVPVPYTEESETRPVDPYAIGKRAGEDFLWSLCEAHGTEYVIAVPGNIIGPRQRYDSPYRGVVSIFINLALQNRPLIIFGDGEQKRRFAPVDSCVDALTRMALNSVNGEIINIGPTIGTAISINDLAALVWSACGHNGPAKIKYVPERVGDVKFAYCDVTKSVQMLGYHHGMSLVQCIDAMVEDVRTRGPRPFNYSLPIEIQNKRTPTAWTERMF